MSQTDKCALTTRCTGVLLPVASKNHMSEFFKNGIVQGVLATIVGAIILGLFGWLKFKRDEKIVTKFLKNSGVETGHPFRALHTNSSATNLSHERIKKVCSKSSKIKRNEKDKESWKLH